MKNKLMFRVLGALASALIIVSVFIPFISVVGYSQSLWQAHQLVGTIYLPIMIIVFGAVGVLVFSTNFKTELAYASAGGLLFFLIMQTIPIVSQGTFNTLGVGYYCLSIGTLLIIIMAFLCGLRGKQKVVQNSVAEQPKEVSMIDQIDKLYNDQATENNISNINSLDNIIQPIPLGESMPISTIPVENQTVTEVPTQINIQPIATENQTLAQVQLQANVQPITNENEALPISSINNQLAEAEVTPQTNMQAPNNVINEINVSSVSNPVVSEFNVPIQNVVEQPNPVIAEFNQNSQPEPIQQIPEQSNISQGAFVSNPVVSEFSQNSQTGLQPQMQQVPQVEPIGVIQPIASDKKVDVMAEPTNNNSNLDIFG